ncbi:MAG: fumarate reductase (quinol) flavoprotein subunit [Myxococcales bacterium]|nr:fumarate reductase (quinol) flavoprotein subunit [Myxococcales bacterium]
MDTPVYDVLLVGGGGAGLRAAIAVAEADPSLSVAVASKVYPMRSHTVAAEGGAAGVVSSEDSLDNHAYDTISGGDWMSDQDVVEYFVETAPKELTQLEHWGCPWSRTPDGKVAVRPFGGMKKERTWFAADKTGFHMLHTLFQTSLKYQSITRYDEWFVSKLLIEDGRCQGVVALEMLTGQVKPILAKAVVLCSGGAGKAFPFTTNGAIKTGDGMGQAYRAGVALKDMEFVQYHPTGLVATGILITEASRGEGGILLNKEGYRYLQDYELGTPLDPKDPNHPQKRSMELGPRDRLSQAFVGELRKGRTIDTPYGAAVHLDIRHLGEAKIDKKIPFVRELCRNYAGLDPVHEPIPVRPVVHYMMGGIHVDIDGATSIPGLYAAGEAASSNLNGANRLGSNSLTELLVFGARTGHCAAEFARGVDAPNEKALSGQVAEERARILEGFLQKEGGEFRVAELRAELHEAMESGAGIYRSEDTLQQTAKVISELRDKFTKVKVDDRSNCFNTELITLLEFENLLDVSEALAHSALQRTESRGAHQRSDHEARDDDKFLKHSLAYKTDGDPRIDYLDVVITRWPPGERVYGKPVDSSGTDAKKEDS